MSVEEDCQHPYVGDDNREHCNENGGIQEEDNAHQQEDNGMQLLCYESVEVQLIALQKDNDVLRTMLRRISASPSNTSKEVARELNHHKVIEKIRADLEAKDTELKREREKRRLAESLRAEESNQHMTGARAKDLEIRKLYDMMTTAKADVVALKEKAKEDEVVLATLKKENIRLLTLMKSYNIPNLAELPPDYVTSMAGNVRHERVKKDIPSLKNVPLMSMTPGKLQGFLSPKTKQVLRSGSADPSSRSVSYETRRSVSPGGRTPIAGKRSASPNPGRTVELGIGKRVSWHTMQGVIRYIGKVSGLGEETWVGVELSCPGRGEHDGTFQGIRYFSAPRDSSVFALVSDLQPAREYVFTPRGAAASGAHDNVNKKTPSNKKTSPTSAANSTTPVARTNTGGSAFSASRRREAGSSATKTAPTAKKTSPPPPASSPPPEKKKQVTNSPSEAQELDTKEKEQTPTDKEVPMKQENDAPVVVQEECNSVAKDKEESQENKGAQQEEEEEEVASEVPQDEKNRETGEPEPEDTPPSSDWNEETVKETTMSAEKVNNEETEPTQQEGEPAKEVAEVAAADPPPESDTETKKDEEGKPRSETPRKEEGENPPPAEEEKPAAEAEKANPAAEAEKENPAAEAEKAKPAAEDEGEKPTEEGEKGERPSSAEEGEEGGKEDDEVKKDE